MQKIALIVQSDETLSSRQRIIVNPNRYSNVDELKDVLSSELNHPDGSPMVLPPSASLSYLDSITGQYCVLKDVSVLANNSRIRIERNPSLMISTASDSADRSVSRGNVSRAGIPPNDKSLLATGIGESAVVESTLQELLVFHAQVVTLLSALIRPDREITPQDICSAYEAQSDTLRHFIEEMWRQQNTTQTKAGGPGLFASLMSQIRVVTQFALQRGAAERESSEGDATDRLKATVSVFQRRVERLEHELTEATSALEHTQQLLLVASQEKEKLCTDLQLKIQKLESDNETKRYEAAKWQQTAQFLQTELSHATETKQRAMLDTFAPKDEGSELSEETRTQREKQQALFSEGFDGSCLPTTVQEERYLDLTRSNNNNTVTHSHDSTMGTTSNGTMRSGTTVHGTMLSRPSTAPSLHMPVVSAKSGGTERILSAGMSRRAKGGSFELSCIVRSLPLGALSARQDTLTLPTELSNTAGARCSFANFCSFLYSEGIGLTADSGARLEISYVFQGRRLLINDDSSWVAFVTAAWSSPPMPGGAARGPAPLSMSVIECEAMASIVDTSSIMEETAMAVSVRQDLPGDQDDESIENFVPSTETQKARIAGARFLGKSLKTSDLVPKKTSSESADEESSAAAAAVSPKNERKQSRLAGALMKLKKQTLIQQQKEIDALSTRSLFLHSACITVPTDEEMKSMFGKLSNGAPFVDRGAVGAFLVKKYDDIGDSSKYLRIAGVGSHGESPVRSGGSRNSANVDFEEFSMMIYRVLRE